MSDRTPPASRQLPPGPLTLPMMPLRDIVLFPESVTSLLVGRPRSVAALNGAMQRTTEGLERRIVLTTQRRASTDEPGPNDVHTICTIATVKTLVMLQNKIVKVLVYGEQRAKIKRFLTADDLDGVPPDADGDVPYVVEVEPLEAVDTDAPQEEQDRLRDALQVSFENYARLSKRVQLEVPSSITEIAELGRRADVVAGYVALKARDKQKLLEERDVAERVRLLITHIDAESDVLRMQRKVRGRFKRPSERKEKAAPQKASASGASDAQDEMKNELAEIEATLAKKPLSAEARERVERELKKLRMMSMMSAEATVLRTYLDWIASLPWESYSADRIDIREAERILDADHYGLDKVKERILEHLAVQKLVDRMRGPILCLAGPPGVGKTSLAKSIARATGREFVRLSLGGVRDEAEIRGHRRTYIGAMPGKIISAFKRSGTSNPVVLLDEIDKMSSDFRGDPSAAMLEVLDPEQNATFVDHYMDLDYDLSKVLFIATANSLSTIAGPLRDRLEIISLPGYTDLEKLRIARTYLVPKQLEANGLSTFAPISERDAQGGRVRTGGAEVSFDDGALKKIMRDYTREAGVRNLERAIGTCCRKAAIELLKSVPEVDAEAIQTEAGAVSPEAVGATVDPGSAEGVAVVDSADTPPPMPADAADADGAADADEGATEAQGETKADPVKAARRAQLDSKSYRVTQKRVRTFMGVEKFQRRARERKDEIGVTNGLAWTPVGGELLTPEVVVYPGKGKLTLTGKLGEVMQESVQAAMSYVRTRATSLGLSRDFYNRVDLHVHVPEGATPKDGPSAGITIATSLVSVLTRIPVRADVAMTGEITLRGKVMAIGGLKEKALAAYREGCTTVVIPKDNAKDVPDIPAQIRRKLRFVPVDHIDEVLKEALAVDDPDAFFASLRDRPLVDVFADSDAEAESVRAAGEVH